MEAPHSLYIYEKMAEDLKNLCIKSENIKLLLHKHVNSVGYYK